MVNDNFSENGWGIPLRNETFQTKPNEFFKVMHESNRTLKLIETVDENQFLNKIFSDFVTSKEFKGHNSYTTEGAVYTERFNRTIRDLLKEPVFIKGKPN